MLCTYLNQPIGKVSIAFPEVQNFVLKLKLNTESGIENERWQFVGKDECKL